MKRFTGFDARHKIKGNVQDARRLLKNRQVHGNASKTQDARFKIRAKKFQPIKQELLKIKSAESSVPKSSLPGRTIMNARLGSAKSVKPQVQKSKMKIPAKEFVSVTDGKRKLFEKVTVHDTGLKIALHNDFAALSSTSKKDESLKITLNNPEAVKKPTVPVHENYRSYSAKEKMALDIQRKQNYSFNAVSERAPPLPLSNKRGFNFYSDALIFPKQASMHEILSSNLRQPPSNRFSHPQETTMYNFSRKVPKDSSYSSEYSPLEGTKILVSNLHPVVVEDDILELFSVIGPLRRGRMTGRGKAEVVYVRKNDAIRAYQKYNNRDLDGQPMVMKLLLHDEVQPHKVNYSWMTAIGQKKQASTVEIEPSLLQRSLFKTNSSGAASKPVVFTVKI